MELIEYKHPLYGLLTPLNSPYIVINADYVSDGDGTGLVHNAPGFGKEDYLACKQYGISPYCPINAFGVFTDKVVDLELVGVFYDKANPIIGKKLEKVGALLKLDFITHSVAHD
jgi:isoleucyl-tRNA synthetase